MTPGDGSEATTAEVHRRPGALPRLQLRAGDVVDLVVGGTSRRFIVLRAQDGERSFELVADPERPRVR